MEIDELYQKFFNLTKMREYKSSLEIINNNVNNFSAQEILVKVIARTLNNIQTFDEKGYQNVSAFQVLAAAKIASDAIKILEPFLKKEIKNSIQKKKIIIGNIFQDYHGLGKEILKVVLQANGYQVIDLGLNVPASKFVETAIKEGAHWILVSAMMYNSALGIKNIRNELKKRIRKDIKVMCGGAPFNYNSKLYKKLKVDYMTNNINEILSILEKK
ncbi:MAG: cobalamin B12-binding domain-containing protein [Candidatus Helarchaeota archaeon]